MKKIFVFILLLLFLPIKIFSHEHWIDLQNFTPSPNEKAKIFICSGHYFPKSCEALSDRVLNETRIITPDGKEIIYETKKEKNRRVGEYIFEKEGTYIILFSLKKPRQKEPLYCAKSIVTVGNKDSKFNYKSGRKMEIIPLKDLYSLKKDEVLPLKILHNNNPIEVSVNISIDGKNFSTSANKEGIMELKITKSGKYLITAYYKGIGCSLSFYVGELKK